MRAKNRGGGLHDHLGKGRGPPEPGVGRQRRTTRNSPVRTAICRLRAQVDVEDGKGRHGCALNHEHTCEGEEPANAETPREGDVKRGANLNAEGWPGPWHHQ